MFLIHVIYEKGDLPELRDGDFWRPELTSKAEPPEGWEDYRGNVRPQLFEYSGKTIVKKASTILKYNEA